jgi:predicted CXXCH cytochrome family protein
MHSSGNYVHPIDQSLGSTVSGNYNAYVKSGDLTGTSASSFTSLVPFVENTGTIATLQAHAKNNDSYLNGPSTSDKVSCLSCHRAHASSGSKQTIRPGNALCSFCHEMPHVQHRSPEVTERKKNTVMVPEDFPIDNAMGVQMLACLGCHKAHQSPERRLFTVPQGDLCKLCHKV